MIDEQVAEEREAMVFAVHPDNVDSVALFAGLDTQWRCLVGPMGGLVRLGIDRSAIDATFRLLGVRGQRRRELFDDLIVMEAAARPILNRPRKDAEA